MRYYLLCGSGAIYCETCRKLCGRAPKKKVTRRAVKKGKPSHLQYVRYHPTAVVTPGWTGSDTAVPVPRIPAYRTYARAVALRNMSSMDHSPSVADVGGVPVLLRMGRKRKAD